MHGKAECAVDADVLRNDRFRQSQFRVATCFQEVFLAAHTTDHDVGAGDVGAATHVDPQVRDAPEQRSVVGAGRLRMRFARHHRGKARQKHRAYSSDEAGAKKIAARLRPSVACASADSFDLLLEAAIGSVAGATLFDVFTHVVPSFRSS